MTKEELFDKIQSWEDDNGESFIDYFAHDNIKESSYAFWLLGKGYNSFANYIITSILNDQHYFLSQSELFEVFHQYDEDGNFIEENYDKNLMLVAEFLVSTPFYLSLIDDWFKYEKWK